MSIDSTIFLIFGLFLLLAGIGAALKIGAWVWIITRATKTGRESLRATPQDYAPQAAAPVQAKSGGLKKHLTIISLILGIISTTVGLVKDCAEEEPQIYRQVPVQPQPIPQQPVYTSTVCCTGAGSCVLMTGPMPVGSACVCIDAMGNTIPGQVC